MLSLWVFTLCQWFLNFDLWTRNISITRELLRKTNLGSSPRPTTKNSGSRAKQCVYQALQVQVIQWMFKSEYHHSLPGGCFQIHICSQIPDEWRLRETAQPQNTRKPSVSSPWHIGSSFRIFYLS